MVSFLLLAARFWLFKLPSFARPGRSRPSPFMGISSPTSVLSYRTRTSFRSFSTSFFATSAGGAFQKFCVFGFLGNVQAFDFLHVVADCGLDFGQSHFAQTVYFSPA